MWLGTVQGGWGQFGVVGDGSGLLGTVQSGWGRSRVALFTVGWDLGTVQSSFISDPYDINVDNDAFL